MPCKDFVWTYFSDFFSKSSPESSPKKTTWILLRVKPMAYRCLDLVSSADDWCYVVKSYESAVLVAIDSRFMREAEEALRKCVELMKRDMELAEALASKNKSESYRNFMKVFRRFLEALREASNRKKSIDRLNMVYVLAKLTFPKGIENRLNKELEGINNKIWVGPSSDNHLYFMYRLKKLAIGMVSLTELLESAEFVATEEKAVEDILTAIRRVFPKEDADKIEEAIEKLRLFKKLLDQTAEVG